MIVFALQAVSSDCLLHLLLICSPMALVFPGDLLALPLCEAASAAAYDTRACADSRVRADGVAHGNACHVTGLLAVARCMVWATGLMERPSRLVGRTVTVRRCLWARYATFDETNPGWITSGRIDMCFTKLQRTLRYLARRHLL